MVFSNSIDNCLVARYGMHHVVPRERTRNEGTNLLPVLGLGLLLSASLLLTLALLEEGLGDEDLVLGRDGTVISD